jgi:hypothetical protein
MPLPFNKFNSRDLNLHYFLTNWAENSLYARFYSVRTACLRYLAVRRKGDDTRLAEMIYLEIIAKIIMQVEDLAHLCLFISNPKRRPNAFYFSTNDEINQFFTDNQFTSTNSVRNYMGLDLSISKLHINEEERKRLEDILQKDIESCQSMLKDTVVFWKGNNLMAKHYLHGIPNFSFQEAKDVAPIEPSFAEIEKQVNERPQDFLTLVMVNDSGLKTLHTTKHTHNQTKQLIRISEHVHNLTKAIAFTELSKLDLSLGNLPYLYFVSKMGKTGEDIALVKKHFITPWLD